MTALSPKPKPHPNTYWVLPGRFLAGEYPGHPTDPAAARRRVEDLVAAGITTFIDLTEAGEGLHPYAHFLEPHRARGVVHRRFPIPDHDIPSAPEDMLAILDAIDGELSRGHMVCARRPVLSECSESKERTGTVVGCLLTRHGHPGQAALHQLAALWSHCAKSSKWNSPETPEQAEYIRGWGGLKWVWLSHWIE